MSKWESGLSVGYLMLVPLADIFNVSTDMLLEINQLTGCEVTPVRMRKQTEKKIPGQTAAEESRKL
ncbi:MAG: hypothetical protein ACLRMZ_00080 [Blautia marasmi]